MYLINTYQQKEFDLAVASSTDDTKIYVRAGGLRIRDCGRADVVIRDTGTKTNVYGCCRVVADDGTTVVLHDMSQAMVNPGSLAILTEKSIAISGLPPHIGDIHRSVIRANDESRVISNQRSIVYAKDNSVVFGTGTIYAAGDSVVYAVDGADVGTYDNAKAYRLNHKSGIWELFDAIAINSIDLFVVGLRGL